MFKKTFLIFTLAVLSCTFDVSGNLNNISITSNFETDDCYITFITDGQGHFVIKQIKNPTPDEQFLLVLDALGCHIAEVCQIPVNVVRILPASTAFPGKSHVDLPATLHTMARGVSTDNDCKFHHIDIRQRIWKPWSHNPISPEKTGLTYATIQNMAQHTDLPKITALDTFAGNADRSPPNLFYDEALDSFCGIDMAASFCSELGQEACRHISQLLQNSIQLTEREKSALNTYVKTMNLILETFPPEKLEGLLLDFARKAGFEDGNSLLDQDVRERMYYHKKIIQNNYEQCQQLVPLIETAVFK